MAVEIGVEPDITSLNSARQKALLRLDEYLKSPREAILREHQLDVLKSLFASLQEGETAGYISLPPGSGKTVVATEIIQALGLRTIIVSPTQTILVQTYKTAIEFTPDLPVGNYYQSQKDLTEDITNTTYASTRGLLNKARLTPSQVELIICDELHTALGEETVKIFREFPNAVIVGLTATPSFDQLEGYRQRGLINEGERWLSLFTNCIHQMNLEDGIERGILTPLDVNIIKSKVSVAKVKIQTQTGDYSRSELETYLATEGRNTLAVAMIAGLDHPQTESVFIAPDQKEEIVKIHQQIKGKRVALFCISIAHADKLTAKLQATGTSAAAVHSQVAEGRRWEIIEAHKRGEIQVILGVDALRLGWDSPPTEVGIYLAPTRSGIVAVQELGRILRPSPETGKDRAIAIQLVDEFRRKTQAPILIPNLFDPYYVLRGTQRGREKVGRRATDEGAGEPVVTFSGMQIEAVIEQAQSAWLLQKRFKQADIMESAQILDGIIKDIRSEDPLIEPLEFYRRIVEALPLRIGSEKQVQAIQAIASLDSNAAKAGKRVLLMINLKSILTAIKPFIARHSNLKDDLVQQAVAYVYDRLETFDTREKLIGTLINNMSKEAAAQVISTEEGMTVGSVRDGQYDRLRGLVEEEIDLAVKANSKLDQEKLVQELVEETELSEALIRKYLDYKLWLNGLVGETNLDNWDELIDRWDNKNLYNMLFNSNVLTPRERAVLRLRFENQDFTLQEVAHELGLSRERARQIEEVALDKAKRWFNRKLKRGVETPYPPSFTREDLERSFLFPRRSRTQNPLPLALDEEFPFLKKGRKDHTRFDLTDEEVLKVAKEYNMLIEDRWLQDEDIYKALRGARIYALYDVASKSDLELQELTGLVKEQINLVRRRIIVQCKIIKNSRGIK